MYKKALVRHTYSYFSLPTSNTRSIFICTGRFVRTTALVNSRRLVWQKPWRVRVTSNTTIGRIPLCMCLTCLYFFYVCVYDLSIFLLTCVTCLYLCSLVWLIYSFALLCDLSIFLLSCVTCLYFCSLVWLIYISALLWDLSIFLLSCVTYLYLRYTCTTYDTL